MIKCKNLKNALVLLMAVKIFLSNWFICIAKFIFFSKETFENTQTFLKVLDFESHFLCLAPPTLCSRINFFQNYDITEKVWIFVWYSVSISSALLWSNMLIQNISNVVKYSRSVSKYLLLTFQSHFIIFKKKFLLWATDG